MIVRFAGSLILPYLMLEIVAIYFYVDAYGFLSFFSEVILSAVFGFFLVFNLGFKNLKTTFNSLRFNHIFSSLGIGFSGFLLFLPGVFSDIFGLIIALICIVLKPKIKSEYEFREFKRDDEVIDVEVVDDSRSIR